MTLLPELRALCGPLTAKRIFRTFAIYLVFALSGFLLASFSPETRLQIFGLGLMLPGGGFLAHADLSSWAGTLHTLTALCGLGGFAFAVFIWFGTGNVLAPPVVWLAFALAATSMNHGHVHTTALWLVIGIISVLFGLGSIAGLLLHIKGKRARQQANDYLSRNGQIIADAFKEKNPHPAELSLDDLKRMRFLLDRALQPLDEFNGFEWLDQFQTAAIRYQLNFLGYALSMAQATYAPAFQGYLTRAQENLILKQADHRVWRYWAIENMWGNLRLDADPVARENIMYTGFCALQMSLYHSASRQHSFMLPGSFKLSSTTGKTYSYDLPALIQALEREAKASEFHLIACEPNWIYPLCNTIGAAAVKSQAPDIWARHEPQFRQMLDQEFLTSSGRIVPCRSNYIGFALPLIGGAMPQAMPSFFLNATMPDIAMRQWLLLRRDIMDGATLQRDRFWKVDTGNYRFSRAAAYAATALTAAELGDTEVFEQCLSALDEECPVKSDDGSFYRPQASVWAHAVEFMARSTRTNSFRTLITTPVRKLEGLHISGAAYPSVLVASAHYTEDDGLRAVLYPGTNAPQHEIQLAGLVAGQTYYCKGTVERSFVADDTGKGKVQINLRERLEISISTMN